MARTTARSPGSLKALAVIAISLIGVVCAKDDARPTPGCTEASSTDTIIGMTQFMGNKNTSDSIWHDELPYFRQHGPISKFTLYRAFFYDGIWHDPGELKGMQFWYGPKHQPPIYTYLDGDSNLFGARKPHIPQEFNLDQDEVITKAELQWDPISMRYAVFTTSKGRTFSWGFKDVEGATKAVAQAPVPGAYVAAIRGFEGKPAPVSKKRYIIQVSIVWAIPTCKPAGSKVGGSIPLESSRLASSKSAQGPSNVYMLDRETVDLIPSGIEGANVVYEGVTINRPVEGTPVPTIPVNAVAEDPVQRETPATAPAAASATTTERQTQQQTPAEKPVATQQPAAKAVAGASAGHTSAPKEAYEHDPAVSRRAMVKPGKAAAGQPAQPAQVDSSMQDIPAGAQHAAAAVPAQAVQPGQGRTGAWTGLWSTLLG